MAISGSNSSDLHQSLAFQFSDHASHDVADLTRLHIAVHDAG